MLSAEMVSEKFKLAVWEFRARGGRLYELAHAHGLTPSTLSATLSGARRVDRDDRIVNLGKALGLREEEVFADPPDCVAS